MDTPAAIDINRCFPPRTSLPNALASLDKLCESRYPIDISGFLNLLDVDTITASTDEPGIVYALAEVKQYTYNIKSSRFTAEIKYLISQGAVRKFVSLTLMTAEVKAMYVTQEQQNQLLTQCEQLVHQTYQNMADERQLKFNKVIAEILGNTVLDTAPKPRRPSDYHG